MNDDDVDRRLERYGLRWREAHPSTGDLETTRLTRGSRRSAVAGIVAAAAVLLAALIVAAAVRHAGSPKGSPTAPSPVPTDRTTPAPASLAFDVPWVDRPTSPIAAFPPTTLPPTGARPCTASDVSVTSDFSEPAGSTLVTGYDFTNRSPTTCMLGGYAAVVATEPGLPSVVARHTTQVQDLPPGNVAPGKSGILVVYSSSCDRSLPVSSTLPARTYHHLVVTLPGGGRTDIGVDFDLSCGGVSIDPFGLREPSPPLPKWFSSLTATLTAPKSVRGGSTLAYVLSLRNATNHSVALTPCPVYFQSVIGANIVIKKTYALNCDRVHAIPAMSTVRYEMLASIPRDATSGDATIGWGVAGGGINGSRAVVRVVDGR